LYSGYTAPPVLTDNQSESIVLYCSIGMNDLPTEVLQQDTPLKNRSIAYMLYEEHLGKAYPVRTTTKSMMFQMFLR
jgi:hypothetical protein